MGNPSRAVLAGVGVTCGALFLAVSLGQDDDGGGSAAAQPKPSAGAPRTTTLSGSPSGPYVALGDSYTSGAGIPAQSGRPAGCDRSDRNYPALVAEELKLDAAGFRDVSCSGATTAGLSAPQSTGHGTNPAQLSALSAKTRLVTVGIGGNDIGFASLVERCVKAGAIYYATGSGKYTGDDAPCRSRYVSESESGSASDSGSGSDSGATDVVRQKIRAVGERLDSTLAEVERRAPQARVYVVGYPAILPDGGHGCDDDMTIAPEDLAFLHDKEQQLNSALRERAEAAGAGYVDTYTPSVGHDACTATGTRWVEPLIPASPAAPVHPNARGERAMADAVLRALRGS
ncbi:SGNH/GDSL hydrolase family protein [Streptomyces sp. R21]|uniref:SGNH/GDSL hydrolase family protein n=1 Tax=Streptomyces sp. R21 TaxID=3238627 RepID=A0AB39PBH4_9ACTN